MGFKKATGKIMAVTDDQILWPDGLLKNCKHDDMIPMAMLTQVLSG